MYDIRDYPDNQYTIRKLADGNCWMVTDLSYSLTANSTGIGSKDDRSTFEFSTGQNCGTDGACIINNNTTYDNMTELWYYSWYAATAGEGKEDVEQGMVDGSICPSGWKIPVNYSFSKTKSWGALTNSYKLTTNGVNTTDDGVETLISFPISLLRGGFYDNGRLKGSERLVPSDPHGRYWSSSYYYMHAESAHDLSFRNKITYPQATGVKYIGFRIRCVVL